MNGMKMHAHSFVLGPDLGIQCSCTIVKNSEHHRISLDTHISPLSQNFSDSRYKHTYVKNDLGKRI